MAGEGFDRELVEQELEWRKCENSVYYFLENYWFISVPPPRGSILLKLRPPQREALEIWESGQNTLNLKARQIGWSTIASGYAFWRAYFKPDEFIVKLSRTEEFAIQLLDKAKYGYARLPEFMVERGPGVVRNTNLKFEFDNGSRIQSMPSKKDAARGTTASLIIADEWASFSDPENAWASISPATDIGGQIIGISTAKGLGNWFHRFWLAAENGINSFVPLFFPWTAVPERDEAWYQKQVQEFEPWQLRQEFPATAEEAFIATGSNFFDVDVLRERIEVIDPAFRGRLGIKLDGGVGFIQEDTDSNLSIWDMPKSGVAYVIGADVAAGVPDGDYSTAHVMDARTHRVVAVYRSKVVPEDFAEALDKLGRFYNTALLGPERNTHGGAVLRLLARVLNYQNLYYHVRGDAHETVTRNPGWQTTEASKATMLNDLGAAIRRARIVLHCDNTLAELMTYRRVVNEKTGREKFEGKPHDDLVISLAICYQMLNHVYVYEDHVPEPEAQPGITFDFALSLARSAPPAGKHTIGYRAPEKSPVVYV